MFKKIGIIAGFIGAAVVGFFSKDVDKPVNIRPVEIVIESFEQPEISATSTVDISSSKKVRLWATYYYLHSAELSTNGVPLRDKKGNAISPKISVKDFCACAMEGTCYVDRKLYGYAGASSKYKVKCRHSSSGRVKFGIEKNKYGTGNRNNPLTPFHSIACDQKKFKYGQKFFIPKAKGVKMPDNSLHDGIFKCEDVGGLIRDNHIDVFLGPYNKSPFEFIKSSSSKTFDAYLME